MLQGPQFLSEGKKKERLLPPSSNMPPHKAARSCRALLGEGHANGAGRKARCWPTHKAARQQAPAWPLCVSRRHSRVNERLGRPCVPFREGANLRETLGAFVTATSTPEPLLCKTCVPPVASRVLNQLGYSFCPVGITLCITFSVCAP